MGSLELDIEDLVTISIIFVVPNADRTIFRKARGP
jgi:hypothetical protein